MFRVVLLFAGLLVGAESALKLPSYVKPCSRNDPNLDECTLKHGIDVIPHLLGGDPKYEIPVLNPMSITEIRIEDPNKGSKPTGVDITMRDLKIYGLDRAVLKKARFDLNNKKFEIACSAPHISLQFKYDMDGKILVLPIKGNGDGMINMTDVDFSYTIDYDLVKKEDGLEYMSPGENKFNYEPRKMIWHLDNLFNGDKALGESTNKVLNENWDVLNAELGPFLSQAIGEVVKSILNAVVKLIPYDEVFPEKV